MTKDAMRVAVAEVMGWKNIDSVRLGWGEHPNPCRFPGHVVGGPPLLRPIPDYPNDLNAMHEAEEWLIHHSAQQKTDIEWSTYRANLEFICGPLRMAHATAVQRCEAFLRTVGRWIDK